MKKMCLLHKKQCRSKEGGCSFVVGVYGMYGTNVQCAWRVRSWTAFMFCYDDNDNKPYFLEAGSTLLSPNLAE